MLFKFLSLPFWLHEYFQLEIFLVLYQFLFIGYDML